MNSSICSCPDTFWNSLFTIVCICLFIVIYDKIKALRSSKPADSPEKMMQGVFGAIGDMLPKMLNNVDNIKSISSAPSLPSNSLISSSGSSSFSSSSSSSIPSGSGGNGASGGTSSSRAVISGPRYARKTANTILAGAQRSNPPETYQDPDDTHTFSVDDEDLDGDDSTIDE